MNEFLSQQFDRVLTVCDHANEVCPVFPGKAERLHRDFFDPSRISGDEPVRLAAFRRARDEIRAWVVEVFGSS
jgi:arsenate reductase